MSEERRRYFRIDDSMGVFYRLLGDEESKALARESKERKGPVDYAANFDNRIHTLLDSCKVQSPIAAELLDLLNKKLNFIVAQMDIDTDLMKSVAYTMRRVNVSACGLAFSTEELLKPGQMLQLDILLHPEELKLMALAKVVDCEPIEDSEKEFFVRLDFTEVSSTDQELLIQHVVKCQSSQLVQRRRDQE
jgi:c-di-GMP-binding flagellar brake protein YcgR